MKRWIIVALIVFAAFAGVGGVLYNSYRSAPPDDTSMGNRITAQEAAIKEAENYTPPTDVMCAQVMTDAVHDETGARFTFSSSCLAPGWSNG